MSGDAHFLRPDNDQERECAECVLPNICLNQGRCLLLEGDIKDLEDRKMMIGGGDYNRLLTTWAECRELLSRERADNVELRRVLESIANNTCCEGCQEAARVAKSALFPNEDPSGQRREPMSPHPLDDEQPFFLTQWEREDYERRQRGEPELGPR